MPTIDDNGALHDGQGRYTEQGGASAAYDLGALPRWNPADDGCTCAAGGMGRRADCPVHGLAATTASDAEAFDDDAPWCESCGVERTERIAGREYAALCEQCQDEDEPCSNCGARPGTPEYDDFHNSQNCWRDPDPLAEARAEAAAEKVYEASGEPALTDESRARVQAALAAHHEAHPARFSAPFRAYTLAEIAEDETIPGDARFHDEHGDDITASEARRGGSRADRMRDKQLVPVFGAADGRELMVFNTGLGEASVKTFRDGYGFETVGTVYLPGASPLTVDGKGGKRDGELFAYRNAHGTFFSRATTHEGAIADLARSTRPVTADRDVEGEYTAIEAKAMASWLVSASQNSGTPLNLSHEVTLAEFSAGKAIRADEMHAALSAVFDKFGWTSGQDGGPFDRAGRLATYIDNCGE